MHVTVAGAGPDLVLLPGWAMTADVWDDMAALLARQFRVHCVDLPAYEASSASAPYTLDTLVDAVAAACVPRATVCGWSLGGQLALRWAEMLPGQVERLVLIATTPRFVRSAGWDHGMKPAVFDAFAQDLAQDVDATLQRFLLLQAHGDTAAREVARQLSASMAARGNPDIATLAAGLRILRDTDLRPDLPRIGQPVLVLHGERDSVVPLGAGEYLQRTLPHAELAMIPGAAHAPFITQPRAVAQRITEFCDG